MTYKKIALFGKMRSGKDAVGEILCKHFGFTRFAYGDAIKDLVDDYFDIPKGVKPREHYQVIGQTFRGLDPEIWIRLLNKSIDGANKYLVEVKGKDPFDVVITDARQENEYHDLKKQGYTLIMVDCDHSIRMERLLAKGESIDPKILNHETEQFTDRVECDYVIENNGSMEDLEMEVYMLIHKLKSGGIS